MNILLGLFFSTIGLIYLKLATRAGSIPLVIIGVTLLVYPYFIPNAWITAGIGIGLTALGFYFSKE